jgi:hypothetical protein
MAASRTFPSSIPLVTKGQASKWIFVFV